MVEYRRRKYYDKKEKKYVCLLEKEERIQEIGLIDKKMSEKIAKMACVISYREVAKK